MEECRIENLVLSIVFCEMYPNMYENAANGKDDISNQWWKMEYFINGLG